MKLQFATLFFVFISSSYGFYLRDSTIMRQIEKGQAIDESKIQFSCGVSDFQGARLSDTVPWLKDKVTYMVLIESKKLQPDVVRKILRDAFDTWSAEIPRNFVEVKDEDSANIRIKFVTGEHGDSAPFEKNSNVYAHADPSGVLHFNDDIVWKVYSNNDKIQVKEIDIFWVALHELGHVLGLAHNLLVPKSVMESIYRSPKDERGLYRQPRLIPADVKDIQEIYGGRVGK